MSQQVPEQHPLRLLFREATDWAFTHGEFPDPGARDARLKGYLADDLLVRFLHVDRLYRLRDARGRPLADVADMLLSGEAAGVSPELHALTVQRHIGDYTLFITGLFPESLERLRRDWRRKDSVLVQLGNLVVPFRDPQEYYEQAGRRAYRSAAEIGREMELAEAELFDKLSRFFRAYVQAMGLVRMYLDASPAFGEYGQVLS
ncbi:MAG: hypothetical protein ACE149_06095 [Armatimonadota bacterium]